MAEVVTRLVVAADGSIRALDQFERGMGKAGQATEFTTGAVADYQRRMDAARAAMERGNALTTQTVQRKSAEQRAWERWSATVDKTTALRIRLEREAANASVAATNAVIAGFATQEQALSTLSALEQRHNAQIAASIAMHNREASAIDNATASMRANTAAANSNVAARRTSGAHAGHTTNLLFQAQDIAMMTAMGQAPMMLAMQQGMQVAGVFHQIGNGRQIVQALGGAVMGLLNPLNLATIAAIGLGAAGVQAFMGMLNGTKNSTDALRDHAEWLGQVLSGYDEAQRAVSDYIDTVTRLPAREAEMSITNQLEQDLAELQRAMDEITHFAMPTDVFSMMNEGIARIREVKTGFDDGAISARDLATELRVISESTDVDRLARDVAERLRDAALAAAGLEDEVEAGRVALRGLAAEAASLANMRIQIAVELSTDGAIAAINELRSLAPDLRTAYEKADEALARGMAAPDAILRQAAQQQYNDTIAALDEQARRKEAEAAASAGGKSFDQWRSANDNFQQRISQQRMELDLLGQSTFEVERQRAAFDLLNQAKQAGVPITADLTQQISTMSAEYAANAVEMERQIVLQQRIAEQTNFYRGTFTGFFSDFRRELMAGTSLWESFGAAASNALDKIADRAISMAANGLFDMIFGAITGGLTGGMSGSWASTAGGAFFTPNTFAPGGFYPGLPGFANGTNAAPAGWAWVGERGRELVRFRGGEQVYDHRRSMAMAANGNQSNDDWPSVLIEDRRGSNAPAIQQKRVVGPNGEKQLRLIVRDEVRQSRRRAAAGFEGF